MAAKTTLNAKNLEALGAERLAQLLLEVSKGNAAAKARIRLELASTASPSALAGEIRKRLAAIARAESYLDWQKRQRLVVELAAQLKAIEKLAKADAGEALDLLWRFLGVADGLFDRTSDSSGQLRDIFDGAMALLPDIAEAARPPAAGLAERVFQAVVENYYGQYDGVVEALAPVLGEPGLVRLEERVRAWGKGPPEPFSHHREHAVRGALQTIALARGDLDAFIAQYDERARKAPAIAADIARRLLDAGRTEEAWAAIEAAEPPKPDQSFDLDDPESLLVLIGERWIAADLVWEEARLAIMEAMGRADEAQAFRWDCFAERLEPSHLKAYLKRLADFDDIEAERRALQHVAAYPDIHRALAFLIGWPALPEAAALVEQRAAELDGNHYGLLTPAADALAARHPHAASLCLRAMIDFTLGEGRSSRYDHAAQHLATCTSLAAEITDWRTVEPHDAYLARLRQEHGRKYGFWSKAKT